MSDLDRFEGKIIAMTMGGGWEWMTKEEAMPNPAGGYWIKRLSAEEQATRDCVAALAPPSRRTRHD